jgi:hypothetical protein
MSRPITSQPDSMVPSAPVNVGNSPAPAMSQDAYSAAVENHMTDRRHKMRKHGAVRGKPFVPQNEQ